MNPTANKPVLSIREENEYGNKVWAVFAQIGPKGIDSFRLFGVLQKEIAESIVLAVNLNNNLLEVVKAQHQAIDRLFALLIEKVPGYLPSKSGQPWEALIKGNEAISRAEGRS